MAPLGEVFYLKEDFWPLNTALYVRDFKGNHPRFIHYVLHYSLRRLKLSEHNAASLLPGVNRHALHQLVVSLPPLPIQRTIAGILAAYDELIEKNTRRIANLEERARLLYNAWFVTFRFPGHAHVRLVESEAGRVPEGWEVVKLGEIAQELRRTVHPASVDPETPYVGLEHLPRRSIALTEWGTAQSVQSPKLWFEKGAILFGKIRPNLHKVCIAPFRGICSSDTIVIVSKQEEYQALVLYHVSGEDFVGFASRTANGTNMPRACWEVLATRPLALPPQPVLAPFKELVKSAVEEIANGLLRNAILRQTRDRLLPGLVSGEIDASGWRAEEAPEMAWVLARRAGPLRRVAEAAGPVEPVGDEGMAWESLWE
jgi:type I restriction enzyme S subunit